MKTVIVSPNAIGPMRNGGIGTFVTHFAQLLKRNGHTVSLLLTCRPEVPRREWQHIYEQAGIPVHFIPDRLNKQHAFGNWWFVQRSEAVARALAEDADIVYFQDWHANGFLSLRKRRFNQRHHPAVVTVLHSGTRWIREGMQEFPNDGPETLSLEYAERYVAEHSDFVVSPSHYMRNWVCEDGWTLPPEPRVRVLGYPFLPDEHIAVPQAPVGAASTFKRLVFFGRLETRMGFEMFCDALLTLKADSQTAPLRGIEEIVFLGKEGNQRFETARAAADLLEKGLSIPVRLRTTLGTYPARQYLAEHVADTLVTMPSLIDNFPFGVIEASLIPGLNLICSNQGGQSEILGPQGHDQTFAPTVSALARKLEECLRQGPKPADRLARYDWQAHNRAWLEFHSEVADFARAAQTASRSFPVVSPASAGQVDVCISYHNLGIYLPQALEALERQTASNFKVYVVNDASTDPLSNDVFDDLAVRYRQQSWQFTTNAENQGLSRTRNIAAAQGQGEYLIFVDADNVPVPEMVERFLTCIQASSDDCLTCYYKAFAGDDPPYRVEIHSGELRLIDLRPIMYKYLPLGNCAELGLFDNVFGDANFIVRRKAFEALGGFAVRRPQYQRVTGEDHEFLARLSLAGYRLDVVPEYLLYYRHRPNSLFRTTSRYWNTMRVLEAYQEKLKQVGLGRLLPLLYGLHMRARELPGNVSYTDAQWIAAHVPWDTLRDALWFKLRKHLERVPFLNRFIR